MITTDYQLFLSRKTHVGGDHGFDPVWMPDNLFDFQRSLVEWNCRKGRSADFADCGLGKTVIQLTWAENVARHTGGRVLVLSPLAVAFQTCREGTKFGIEVENRRDGLKPGDRIVATNYERLHYFDSADFDGVVCDESSILKNFDGTTRQSVTDFMRKIKYRLLCTATAAPNDYVELGTSSEALGWLEHKHMLAQFFTHDGGDTAKWRLKGHAREHLFWRWVCSWARAVRRPSDLGFDDADFALPLLIQRDHKVTSRTKAEGLLFDLPAVSLDDQRDELRRTINERCEMVAQLVNSHDKPAVAWCNLNDEGCLMEKLIPGSLNIEGSDSEDAKEEAFDAFSTGQLRVIISKPKIAGFGLNWQHCSNVSFFPSHSYEQYYQAIRRCWRFGQKNDVTVDCIFTDGQSLVLQNLKRKAEAAGKMFEQLVLLMRNELHIERQNNYTKIEQAPSWL